MGPVEKKLIDRIFRAFEGVTLEDGISLNMTEYLDGYESEPEYLRKAEFDERDDWTAIPGETLEMFTGTFSFTDLKGFRFYLPAYMSASLRDFTLDISDHTLFSLDPEHFTFERIGLINVFTDEQLKCITEFLKYAAENVLGSFGECAGENLKKIQKSLKARTN